MTGSLDRVLILAEAIKDYLIYYFRRNHNNIYKYENHEPIAANYYPITNKIFISDNKTSMAILTDRAQGCTSLKDGQIEILVNFLTQWFTKKVFKF